MKPSSQPVRKYDHKKIENKWQKTWQLGKIFRAKDGLSKNNRYVLVEFPYPSGEGLHMGHLRPYVAADVYSRYLRMQGKNVLFPIGWDAFGLPAENYAIKNCVHPKISTAKNIKNAKRQMLSWGMSFDWSREINTTDQEYYKWTQWIFLQFYKSGLAYQATGAINWCPKDKTGLANEEVIDGKCERCGTVVEKKELRQWYLKITAYAEKLLEGLKTLDWPERVKLQQENWIGKSVGAEIDFAVQGSAIKIPVFTTRPDTIFGATYLVVAPEHPVIKSLQSQIGNAEEVKKYIEYASRQAEIERVAEGKEKTGVELRGVKAVNPATKQEIPIWVADYVLGNYGTGAIMAVPAHDERDFAFANRFALPIIKVIDGSYQGLDRAVAEYGTLIDSGAFSGMKSEAAIPKMAEAYGRVTVQYKLRDWVFSRQRYWGEPIPIVHCQQCGVVPVPEKDLPVKLPPVKKYEPTGTGESPLAVVKKWVNTKCPKCKGRAKRETNTMPQWAGSSWYWLRYADPRDRKIFADKKKQKIWTPVDIYFGGMEHTTLHLLYSRFWNLFLYDKGLATSPEPYKQRKPHGIVLASDGEKMSKSRGNVVNPDVIVKHHGADTLRMYELFLGPHEMEVSWNDQGVSGVRRFLDRVWIWAHRQRPKDGKQGNLTANRQQDRLLHKLIKKVTEDLEGLRFNTCVSSFMEFHNLVKDQPVSLSLIKTFLRLLYPFAPHITEQINRDLGGKKSLQLEPWPKFDPRQAADEEREIVVQVNGKVKAKLTLAAAASAADMRQAALSDDRVKEALGDRPPRRVITVPGRLINFVV